MNDINIMYVAVAHGGQWEDSWEKAAVASFDIEKIKRFIAKKEAEITENNRVVNLLYNHDAQYRANVLQPEYLSYADAPHWPSGLGKHEITQDMRDKRAQIVGKNEMVAALNAVRYHQWDETRKIVRKEYFDTIDTVLEYDEYMQEIDEVYRIDEIEAI